MVCVVVDEMRGLAKSENQMSKFIAVDAAIVWVNFASMVS